ncbi:arginase [Thermomonas brevis]|jgi:arginase|uniref:Arginase n=1 Tax=Thermomonas brevis TaxID=215691 RepID=A0A7G9QQ79_9GAMM|nr:arginase [Thermomonas brevis]QNN45504.1 arginase [Thermomonas brevis]
MTRTYPPVSVFGVPTDIGASRRGASMGPEALRVAGLVEAIAARGVDARDIGDVQGPRNPIAPPVQGYRHLDEVVAWNRAVFDASAGELRAGRMPIMLGGDHCLAIGSIAAVAAHCRASGKKLRVLWLDAHADFNTSDITPSGNIHGMPVACLVGLGPEVLTTLGGATPAITPEQVRQIGIRSVDPEEKRLVKEHGLDIYDMRYIDEVGMRRTMETALDGVDADTHLHVSFDVDMLDPSIAPGTGTRVPGGVNYREAQLIMEMVADTGRLGSLDLVEVNPALDRRNATAKLAVDLVESLFGKSTLMRD